jgi:hypothetical protein
MRSRTSTLWPAHSATRLGLGARLEPGRDVRVPQVVRMPGKGRGDLGVGERDDTGFDPHPAVGAFREVAAAQAAEQAAIGGRAVLVQVFEDQADERWRDWYWADRAFRPVLELAFLRVLPVSLQERPIRGAEVSR